jgi:hypothetical protein
MGRRNSFSRGNKLYRKMPVINKANLPHDDTAVLQHEPLPPLERGGVYTEMGADLTYEEMHANQGNRLSNFGDKSERKNVFTGWYVGMLALIVSIAALFIWPFWTGLSGLILSMYAYRQGTRAIAWVSIVLSSVAIIMSVVGYFSRL